MKWKVLPRPTSESTQIRPPISAVSLAEMVKPRPVPPNFRIVKPLHCTKGSKIVRAFSGAIPMPVSATEQWIETTAS